MALHINSLPDDILAMVIGYAQRLEQETRGLWSKRQPVLSVCRRWRCVAMPIVYREIFVWCEEGTASTNAGLAAELGAAHMARSVCMTVLYDGDPVRSMRSALSALQGDDKPGRRWDRVKRLDLYVHPVADEALAKSQGAADVVRAVANLLPGVEALRLDDHASDSFTLSVYRGLASAYAGQLRRLNSSYIWGASTSPLARLTHLEVRFDALRCLSMPRVCTDTLVSLSLVGATTQQAWLQLMEGGTDGPAALGSLEHLYVSYHSGPSAEPTKGAHIGPQRRRVSLPRLRTFVLLGAREPCCVAGSVLLPPSLDALVLDCSAAVFHQLAAGAPRAARAVGLTIRCGEDADTRALFPAISHVLAGAQTVLDAELRVDTDRFALACKEIDWPPFTRIAVAQRATVGGIAAIRSRLSQQAELAVCGEAWGATTSECGAGGCRRG